MHDTTKLTILKHLASGKSPQVVSVITGETTEAVLEVAKNHGYPDTDKLSWAADILAKNIAKAEHAQIPAGTIPRARTTAPPATSRPGVDVTRTPEPLTKPDEIRILINTAKSHPSKRIQTAADRLLDQVSKLRQLIRDDEEKNSAKRLAEVEKAKARAEVERLEKALAAAKAKLRGKSTPQTPGGRAAAASGQLAEARSTAQSALISDADLQPYGLTSKTLRAWALEQPDLDCPTAGRLHRRILDAWIADHPAAAAS